MELLLRWANHKRASPGASLLLLRGLHFTYNADELHYHMPYYSDEGMGLHTLVICGAERD